MPADLFGAGTGQRRYSQALPVRGDAGALRRVSEKVNQIIRNFPAFPCVRRIAGT